MHKITQFHLILFSVVACLIHLPCYAELKNVLRVTGRSYTSLLPKYKAASCEEAIQEARKDLEKEALRWKIKYCGENGITKEEAMIERRDQPSVLFAASLISAPAACASQADPRCTLHCASGEVESLANKLSYFEASLIQNVKCDPKNL